MRTVKKNTRRAGFLAALLGSLALIVASAAPAALAAPVWRIDSLANTTAAPGGQQTYLVQVTNVGDEPAPVTVGGDESNCSGGTPAADPAKCWRIEARFAAGLTPAGTVTDPLGGFCSIDAAANSVSCSIPGSQGDQQVQGQSSIDQYRSFHFTVDVAPTASGELTAAFRVSGGEAANSDETADPTLIASTPPEFGVDAFDAWVTGDAAGAPLTQAAGRPYEAFTAFDVNTLHSPDPFVGDLSPVEATRDVVVDLPPGFVGNPAAVDQCSAEQIMNGGAQSSKPLCPPGSQIGTVLLRYNGFTTMSAVGPLPLFNMVPPAGVPARFGVIVLGALVVLDAEVRPSDNGVRVAARNTVEFGVQGVTAELWGVPSDPVHDRYRNCPGELAFIFGGQSCGSGAPRRAFLRNPTSCAPPGVGLPTTIRIDSWQHPGVFRQRTVASHLPTDYPQPTSEWGPEQGTSGCDSVPFDPGISLQPLSRAAGRPTGLAVDLTLPQNEDPGALAESDLRKAVVTLPEGMRVNASSADGLGACAPDQIKLGTNDDPTCPDSSKIGSVTIDTPLLRDPVGGSIYLAKPLDNPSGTLLALYIVAQAHGVTIKLPGSVKADPQTGRIETAFDNNPQLPFSNLHVQLKDGPRAPLSLPSACGTYTTTATFTGWNGATVQRSSKFTVDQGPDGGPCRDRGFDPKLSAGTRNPAAGKTSPFVLRLTREDSDQELSRVTAHLPQGLVGYLKGIPYCPESALGSISGAVGAGAAQIASPSCPAASQVGRVTVGAGAGPSPFFVDTGKAYLAGPYKGAPLSVAFVTPAVAGPFDLGSVVVRAALRVDPTTARITTVADPLPTNLYGIPLDVRDVRVAIDRDHFTLNPTSCEPMSIDTTVTSTQGQTANLANRFQAAGCDRLGFKPKLALRLKGKTRRTGNPALRATLTMPPGGANIAQAQVSLPHSEFLDQGHIRTICTRVQFAAGGGGGEQCPAGSVYGHATAFSPLLGEPLSGPVYLRSSDNPLPDLVAALDGQIHVDLVGRIDSHNGGIRTTFEGVPDAPVSKFVLQMQGGRKGLLQNSTNICRGTHRASALFDGQNGKIKDLAPALVASCGAVKRGHGKRRH